jgi:hypothetical protein
VAKRSSNKSSGPLDVQPVAPNSTEPLEDSGEKPKINESEKPKIDESEKYAAVEVIKSDSLKWDADKVASVDTKEEPEPIELPPEAPSVEEIMDMESCSEATAIAIHRGLNMLRDEKVKEQLLKDTFTRPHYRVQAKKNGGYWKIGRHFSSNIEIIFADELTKEQRDILESANAKVLKVEKVNFGGE